jgi:hypothetical protein
LDVGRQVRTKQELSQEHLPRNAQLTDDALHRAARYIPEVGEFIDRPELGDG